MPGSLALANCDCSKMSTPPAAGVDNADQELPDVTLPDAEVVDAKITDTGIADPETVDTEMADTEVADKEGPNGVVQNEDQIPLQPAPEGSLSLPTIGTEGSHSPLFLPSPVLEASAYRPKVVERDGIEVKVPPVEQRWEYRPYHASKDNPTHSGQAVKSRRANITNRRKSEIPHRSSSTDRVVRRSGRQTRPTKQFGGDADLSSEDALVSGNTTNPSKAQKRGRLSAVNDKKRNSEQQPSVGSNPSDSASEEGGSEDGKSGKRRHSGRSSGKRKMNYAEPVVNEDSSETDDTKSNGKRRRGPKNSDGRKKRKTGGSDYSERTPVEGTRRSGRVGRAIGGMREVGEDEEYYKNDLGDSTAAPKFHGAKEIYKELPIDNEFRLRHCQTCDVCQEHGDDDEKGHLVYCQGCTISYHQKCLGQRASRDHIVTKIGEEDFVLQCRRCIGVPQKKDRLAPRQGSCSVCHEKGRSCAGFREKKTSAQEQKDREDNDGKDPIQEVATDLINNARNVLFRCIKCYRTYHMYHLPARTDERASTDLDQDQLESERFKEYSEDWQCQDCMDLKAGIDSLVAWRPINKDKYGEETPTDEVPEDEKEYLVKFRNLSYFKAVWKPGAWVWGVTATAMRSAFAKRENGYHLPKMTTEDAIPEEYLRVDIVLDVEFLKDTKVPVQGQKREKERIKDVKKAFVKFKGLGYEDAVWEEPPDSADTDRWGDFKSAYEEWVLGKYVHLPAPQTLEAHLEKVRAKNFEKNVVLNEQPEYVSGGKLMEYQMEGLNWLYYRWHQRQNTILADEMGLGKTIQVIAFLATLQQKHKCWPFLIIVPNSTCPNWRRELKRWAPSLRVVAYYGLSEARRLSEKYELFPGGNRDLRCHVVVASYEAAQADEFRKVFRGVPWQGLIVDEGQRLKSDKTQLYDSLNSLKTPFKALMTGTPLQNNPRELFNLLQFLDKSFDAQAMEIEYATLTKENVPQLHELLRKMILRRTKAEVLKFLPPMAQVIVPVTMSVLQKKLYKSIIAKNADLIKSIFGATKAGEKPADRASLNNILMQLRKCLCHPFVYSRAIEERSSDPLLAHKNLVEASAKLKLLEIMLPRLKELGHRVLIFSQFLDMLDIIEDFLDGLNLTHERLDGSVSSLHRQKRIDEFNSPGSRLFAFLLSTRAGGVGINLATADTVIIFDPDFNPHQDMQALSRAHRIGQEKKVLVFQLITRNSAEEKIMQIGKKKMALDHALIEQMGTTDDDAGMDVDSILRHGAEALFKDGDEYDIHYDSASVDKLLDRTHIENTPVENVNQAEMQFSFARVWANDKASLEDIPDEDTDVGSTVTPSTWENILRVREQQAAEEAAAKMEAFGRGRRKRQSVDYTRQSLQDSPRRRSLKADSDDSDTEFNDREEEESAEEIGMDGDEATLDKDDIRDDNFRLPEPERARTRSVVIDDSEPISVTSGEFSGHRVVLPISQEISGMVESSGNGQGRTCLACDGTHASGRCPVRLAGVELCGLCGLAHYGSAGRPCPQFRSMEHCRAMIEALKHSTEPRAIVELAKKYLYGVIGSISRKTKEQNEKLLSQDQVQAPPRVTASKKVKSSSATRGNMVGHFANGLI